MACFLSLLIIGWRPAYSGQTRTQTALWGELEHFPTNLNRRDCARKPSGKAQRATSAVYCNEKMPYHIVPEGVASFG